MVKAVWNGKTIAESNKTEVVEGNHYFPPESLVQECFQPSATTSHCGWKGTASYYNVTVEGETIADAAWCYPEPKSAASQIKGHVAFWKGVTVEGASEPTAHDSEPSGQCDEPSGQCEV